MTGGGEANVTAGVEANVTAEQWLREEGVQPPPWGQIYSGRVIPLLVVSFRLNESGCLLTWQAGSVNVPEIVL